MGAMQDLTGSYAAGTAAGRLAGRSGVFLSLTGGRELIRNFDLLPVRLQKRVARAAVTKVARAMVKMVKKTMETERPKAIDTGLLRKSIGFRVWSPKSGQWAVGATIGPRKRMGTLVVRTKKGKKALTKGGIAKVVAAGGSFRRAQFADPVKYAHLVERGADREGSSKGNKGKVEGRPFMGHAYIRSRDVMAGTLRTEIWYGIEREARKLAKLTASRAMRYGN